MKLEDKIKECITCHKMAPHAWYNAKNHKHGGFFCSYCRKCNNRMRYERRKNDPKWRGLSLSPRRDEVKRQAFEYKGSECERCGLNDDCLAVYDFHHNEDKKFGIAKYRPIIDGEVMTDRFKKELDKCSLLCSNCHRRQHHCCKR